MPSELERRLQAMHRAEAPGQDAHRRADEERVMAAFEARRAELEDSKASRGRRRLPRLALGGVLGVAVAVGACALPAEYPMQLGYGLEITVDASRIAQLDGDAIGRSVGAWPGAERVEIRMAHRVEQIVDDDGRPSEEEQLTLQLFVFGGGLDTDAMWDELRTDFPVLADARIHDVPLAGTVDGTLGGKLSHRLLDLTIDREGVEQAERRILAELMAEGIAPEDASVDIEQSTDEDGRRRIEVRVEAERHDSLP